ncbi:enoyl-CoA hydratase/isomerase family protein [Leucobacter albus]|uniref:Enoyl-CoA hydratase/isomerase family protein n=1 Tax=Leucobacter albus TaxID=272210 RepID=A0ABW3TPG1_9MICO
MTGGAIRLAVRDGIGTIEIDRPAKRNALTPELCDDLASAVRDLDRDPAVRVIALTGAGGNFSAGADIAELPRVLFDAPEAGPGSPGAPLGPASSTSGADPRPSFDHLTAADEAFGAAQKPTVALVRGICMGGGWQLASACDVVLCSDDARIAITPALLGIVYPRRGVARLVRMVGPDRAKYLLFSGARISPADAERWGLVTALLPAGDFDVATAEYLARVAANSQYSVQTSKRLIDAGTGAEGLGGGDLDAAWREVWREMPANPDLASGRPAFLAGRSPEFSWRGNAPA